MGAEARRADGKGEASQRAEETRSRYEAGCEGPRRGSVAGQDRPREARRGGTTGPGTGGAGGRDTGVLARIQGREQELCRRRLERQHRCRVQEALDSRQECTAHEEELVVTIFEAEFLEWLTNQVLDRSASFWASESPETEPVRQAKAAFWAVVQRSPNQ